MKKKKIQHKLFASYLDDGEKIVHIAHKHPLVLKIKGAKTSFFGIMLPTILYFFVFQDYLTVFLVWWGVGAIGMFYHFIDWYFDAWLLTNIGIVDVEQNGFFDMTSTRIEYHMIEGISYTINGFWRTVFNFGDITVDKLGAKTSVVLRDANNPKKLERLVMKFQEKYVFEKSVRDHSKLKDMLSEMIAYHVQGDKIKIPKD